MPTRRRKTRDPFEGLLEYEGFLSILKYYVDLNCFAVPPGPGGTWVAVYHHQRMSALFDFQKKYGFTHDWKLLSNEGFLKERRGKPLLIETMGFNDIFAPILRNGKRMGSVLSGTFVDREMTAAHLRESWKVLTGQEDASENPEFREFVRVMLETPVLEPPVLEAYRESLEIFARILAHEDTKGSHQRLKELMVGIFSKHLPHSYWMKWALGIPTQQATPVWNMKVQDLDWVRSEISLTRIPTTVITAVPTTHLGRRSDPIEEMIRIYRFQRRAFAFARTLPETVGDKLENYGAVFVLSPDPAKNRIQRRRQVLEAAERIHRFSEDALGGQALVGIGETVEPGEFLHESYRQAVFALHLGRQYGKKLVFFNLSSDQKSQGLPRLRHLLAQMRDQLSAASFSGMEATRDEFLRQVLTLSFLNHEEIRWQLHYGLLHLMDTVKEVADMGEREVNALFDASVLSLDLARTTQEMIQAFKEAVDRLMNLTQGLGKLKESYSIEKAKEFIEKNFKGKVRLARLAKKCRISLSTLSRRFKKSTGMGMEDYLQSLRFEEAKRLLRTGSLPVARIARVCGFGSSSHFIHSFGKKTGISPQKFRERSPGA